MSKVSFRVVTAATWLLALANYVVNNPWGLFSAPTARALNHAAGIVGSGAFLLWALVVALAFRTYGKKAWWLMLSAPLAMGTFLGVAAFVIGSLIIRH